MASRLAAREVMLSLFGLADIVPRKRSTMHFNPGAILEHADTVTTIQMRFRQWGIAPVGVVS